MVKQPLTVEHALLGFLRRQPMYGYEIHQRLLDSAEMGLVWNIKQSLLYALLARLEDEGYLTSTLAPQGAKPARKILALTPAGAAAFVSWVSSPVPHGRDFRLEFMAKLYFARAEGPALARSLIAAQIAASTSRRDNLRDQAGLAVPHSYDWLVLCYRVGQLDATLSWLELCGAAIGADDTATPERA
jgi:DNA-binding PadR family transcriptional regulator